jgi:hypothetical protein
VVLTYGFLMGASRPVCTLFEGTQRCLWNIMHISCTICQSLLPVVYKSADRFSIELLQHISITRETGIAIHTSWIETSCQNASLCDSAVVNQIAIRTPSEVIRDIPGLSPACTFKQIISTLSSLLRWSALAWWGASGQSDPLCSLGTRLVGRLWLSGAREYVSKWRHQAQ